MKPSRMIQGLLDLLFSPQCVICGETRGDGTGDGICHTCRSQIGYITSPLCHRCGLPFIPESGIDHFCQDCLQSSLFFGIARALGRYEGGLKEAITRFKYQEKIALGEHLGSIMVQGTYPGLSFSLYHVLMPVPLHPKRLRERGFNQAAVLASQLSRRYRIPLDLFSLRRIRPTESQIHLGFHERRKNVKGAFTLKDAEKVQRKNILVIDDVYTSGATVNECAKVLMKAGAARVDVLTLARAV